LLVALQIHAVGALDRLERPSGSRDLVIWVALASALWREIAPAGHCELTCCCFSLSHTIRLLTIDRGAAGTCGGSFGSSQAANCGARSRHLASLTRCSAVWAAAPFCRLETATRRLHLPCYRPQSPPWRFHGVRRPQTKFFAENGRQHRTSMARPGRLELSKRRPYARGKPGSPTFLLHGQLSDRFYSKRFRSIAKIGGGTHMTMLNRRSSRGGWWQIPGFQEMAAFDVCLVTMPAPPYK
jgi:hypothetical protein